MQAHRKGGQSITRALAHSQVPLVWCPHYVILANLFPSLVCLSPCISPHQRTGVAGVREQRGARVNRELEHLWEAG